MSEFQNIVLLYKNPEFKKIIDMCFNTTINHDFNYFIKQNKDIDSIMNYKELELQNINLKNDIEELRTNYWNLHKHYIKKK